jgi:hypothetical protein
MMTPHGADSPRSSSRQTRRGCRPGGFHRRVEHGAGVGRRGSCRLGGPAPTMSFQGCTPGGDHSADRADLRAFLHGHEKAFRHGCLGASWTEPFVTLHTLPHAIPWVPETWVSTFGGGWSARSVGRGSVPGSSRGVAVSQRTARFGGTVTRFCGVHRALSAWLRWIDFGRVVPTCWPSYESMLAGSLCAGAPPTCT